MMAVFDEARMESIIADFVKHDDDWLLRTIERCSKKQEQEKGSQTGVPEYVYRYYAAMEVLAKRSKESRKHQIFSRRQAGWLLFFTGTLAFCAFVTVIIEILKYMEL